MKLVDVERDDAWCPGFLEGWRRDESGWLSYVRYSVAVEMQHLEQVDAERVRKAPFSHD